jgi:plasmid maintenance system antidote protein VapI
MLTAKDVAETLQVHVRTARRIMRSMIHVDGGEGRRLLRVTESALARWLQNREQVECRLHEDSGERKAEAASFGTAGIRSPDARSRRAAEISPRRECSGPTLNGKAGGVHLSHIEVRHG